MRSPLAFPLAALLLLAAAAASARAQEEDPICVAVLPEPKVQATGECGTFLYVQVSAGPDGVTVTVYVCRQFVSSGELPEIRFCDEVSPARP